MPHYDMLGKPLRDLTIDDLPALRTIEEGWYTEYKQEVPAARSVAKSISSFSNHYGGNIYYGVLESRRLAVGFPGIPTRQSAALVDRIRDAARTLLHPTPHFDIRVFDGPSDNLGLDADRSIIAVGVPPGANPPYIHASGAIYQRVADSSDPRPITDRHLLDVLYQRSRDREVDLRARVQALPRLSVAEDEAPYLQLSLFHEGLWEEPANTLSHAEFAGAMAEVGAGPASTPFEVCFPSSSGYIARQIGGNDPYRRGFTWNYDLDGFHTVTIPLVLLTPARSTGYHHFADFVQLVPAGVRDRTIDWTLLFPMLLACIEKFTRLAALTNAAPPFVYKAQLVNVWRTAPFLDLTQYIASIRAHGMPIVQSDSAYAPHDFRGLTLGKLLEEDTGGRQLDLYLMSLAPYLRILEAAGVETSFMSDPQATSDLFDSARRASALYRAST